jgi:CDP-glycerol glycerophosphotransferase (TagB/SpsB family)
MRHLFYVSQLYSFSILRPLQRVIRERGDACAWFCEPAIGGDFLSSEEKFLSTIEQVNSFNPDVVYAPGNIVPDFFPGIKVQLLHGLATDAMGKKGHYRDRGFFDLYCTHGPEGTARFQLLAQKFRHFKVVETGWPKLDPIFQSQGIASLKEPLALTSCKPMIIYAPTFSPSVTSAYKLFSKISELARVGTYHWLIKFHPKMNAEITEKFRLLAGQYLTFFESHEDVLPLLHAADLMVSDNSSITVEFQLMNKPLVTFNTLTPGPHLINITDPDELEGALAYALTRPEKLMSEINGFVDRFHPYRDGLSSQRVLDAVKDFADSGSNDLKSKPLNLIRKFKIRRKLGHYKVH